MDKMTTIMALEVNEQPEVRALDKGRPIMKYR